MTAFIEALKSNTSVKEYIENFLKQDLTNVSPKRKKQIILDARTAFIDWSKLKEEVSQGAREEFFANALSKFSEEEKERIFKEEIYKYGLLSLSKELVSNKQNLSAEQFKQGFDAILDQYVLLAEKGKQVEVFGEQELSTENADEIALIKRLQLLKPADLHKENPHNWVCSPILKSILLAAVQHMRLGAGEFKEQLMAEANGLRTQNNSIKKDEAFDVIRLTSNYYVIDKKNQSKDKSYFELARTAKQFNPKTGEVMDKAVDFTAQMWIALVEVRTQEDFLNFSKELVRNRSQLSSDEFKTAFFMMLHAYKHFSADWNPPISEKDKEFIEDLKDLEDTSLESGELVNFLRNEAKDFFGDENVSVDLSKLITGPIRHMATESSDFKTMAIDLCLRAVEPDISAEDTNKEYMVIRVPKKGKRTEDSYYIADKKTALGEGTNAVLLTAQAINPKTGEIIKNAPPLAVKNFKRMPTPEEEAEIEMQSDYFPVGKVQSVDGEQVFLFTELLRESNLQNFLKTNKFETLSAEQRLDLMLQIVFSLNMISHDTASTKEALVHRDIKPANVMVFFDDKGAIHAQIIDFGLAYPADKPNPDKSGTPAYMAPEVMFKKTGLKSDIFSLGTVFAEILGVDVRAITTARWKALRSSKSIADLSKNYEDNRLDFSKMVSLGSEKYWQILGNKITNFISNRMDVVDYEPRADNDEVMRFFIEARKFAGLAKEYEELKKGKDTQREIQKTFKELNICLQKMLIVQIGAAEFPFGLFNQRRTADTDNLLIGDVLFNKMHDFVQIDENLTEQLVAPSADEKQNLSFFLNAVSQLAKIEEEQALKNSLFDEAMVKKLEDSDFCKMLCLLSDDERRPKFSIDELIGLEKVFQEQQKLDLSPEIVNKVSEGMEKAWADAEAAWASKIPLPQKSDSQVILEKFEKDMLVLKNEKSRVFGRALISQVLSERDAVVVEELAANAQPVSSEASKVSTPKPGPYQDAVIRLARAEEILGISLFESVKANQTFFHVISSISPELFEFLANDDSTKDFSVDKLVSLTSELYEKKNKIPKAVADKISEKITKAYKAQEDQVNEYVVQYVGKAKPGPVFKELTYEVFKINEGKRLLAQMKNPESLPVVSLIDQAFLDKVEGLGKNKSLLLKGSLEGEFGRTDSSQKESFRTFVKALVHLKWVEKKAGISTSQNLIDSVKGNENFCKIIPSLSVNLLVLMNNLESRQNFSVDELVRLSGELFQQRDKIPKDLWDKSFKAVVSNYMMYKQGLNPNGHERWFFGYNNQAKQAAAQELLNKFDAISSGEAVTWTNKGALTQGNLGEIAKPLMSGPGKG